VSVFVRVGRVRVVNSKVVIKTRPEKLKPIINQELGEAMPVCITDKNKNIIHVNKTFYSLFNLNEKQTIDIKCHELIKSSSCESDDCPARHILRGLERYEYEFEREFSDGRKVCCLAVLTPYRGSNDNIAGIIHHYIDISRCKQAEAEMKIAQERLVVEQVALREKNIVLKEIMNRIDDEKKQIAFRIQSNVDRLVMPILRKLKEKANSVEKDYIRLLEGSLSEITSPFISQLEKNFAELTPREIEICNLVKDGLTCKDIAGVYDISEQTVIKHRKKIRKKLGIGGQKINLISYLKSMSDNTSS